MLVQASAASADAGAAGFATADDDPTKAVSRALTVTMIDQRSDFRLIDRSSIATRLFMMNGRLAVEARRGSSPA
jgi:hypothetical protein